MRKFYILLLNVFFLSGCSSNKPVVENPLESELLAYTQKFESVKENERYLAIGTYLNPIHTNIRNDKSEEKFLLISYPKDIKIKTDSLKINKDSNLTVKELSKNDPILQLLTIKIPWSNYYEITTPEKNSDYLSITYQTDKNLDVSLKFMKISKSLYWAPEHKIKKQNR